MKAKEGKRWWGTTDSRRVGSVDDSLVACCQLGFCLIEILPLSPTENHNIAASSSMMATTT
jgi:hypothetical protein